ncbi:MAG TPA: SDR family oxidoreductase, partial [Thermoanaerobaculia bacterium]|nr:SDR family oxidoreductase [Thermoanaerobaculia bacterium]
SVLIQYLASDTRAGAILQELRRLSDAPHFVFRCDVTDGNQVELLFDAVEARWGGLDCLVNNAGVWVHDPLAQIQSERLQATFAVNVVGPFLCARYAIPRLTGSDNASIINISSTAGQRGEAFYSAYAASKGALISATKSWSSELAPEIRVNAVAPGWVDTEMTSSTLSGEYREQVVASIPLHRIATPEDIAGPVLFLASPLARHITGEILNVNGGSVLIG